jgi:hypothetical protein
MNFRVFTSQIQFYLNFSIELHVYWQALHIIVYYNIIHIIVDLKMAQLNGLKHVVKWTPINIDESQYRLIPKNKAVFELPLYLEFSISNLTEILLVEVALIYANRQTEKSRQTVRRTDGLKALYISIEKRVFMAIECGRQQ